MEHFQIDRHRMGWSRDAPSASHHRPERFEILRRLLFVATCECPKSPPGFSSARPPPLCPPETTSPPCRSPRGSPDNGTSGHLAQCLDLYVVYYMVVLLSQKSHMLIYKTGLGRGQWGLVTEILTNDERHFEIVSYPRGTFVSTCSSYISPITKGWWWSVNTQV